MYTESSASQAHSFIDQFQPITPFPRTFSLLTSWLDESKVACLPTIPDSETPKSSLYGISNSILPVLCWGLKSKEYSGLLFSRSVGFMRSPYFLDENPSVTLETKIANFRPGGMQTYSILIVKLVMFLRVCKEVWSDVLNVAWVWREFSMLMKDRTSSGTVVVLSSW